MNLRRHASPAVVTVGGMGLVTFVIHSYHLLVFEHSPLASLFGAAIPMATAAGLIVTAVWLATTDFREATSSRIAVWCIVGAVALLAVAAMIGAFQYAMGIRITDGTYVLLAHVTIGAQLGTLIGVYDAQRYLTQLALSDERETADRLGRRITVLNRVLRHDLRNSINVIQGNAKLIAEGAQYTEKRADVIISKAAEIVTLSERAREVESVLADPPNQVPVGIGEAVENCVSDVLGSYPEVDVHISVDTKVWVETIPSVEIALERLLENAIQHHDKPSPTIWVDVAPKRRNGEPSVEVRIADDGPGIPPEQIEVLERGKETPLEHTDGFGLWQVNWIVEQANGKLRIGNRTPRGSVIEISIPGLADRKPRRSPST